MIGKGLVSRSLFTIFFVIPLVVVLEIPVFLAGAALGTYIVFSRNLPEIPELASYQPRTVSTFYADDGTVIGSFYKEKRFVVDLAQIPPHVLNAFLASEDVRFYQHSGVDWAGLVRAMIRNLRAGKIVQGGARSPCRLPGTSFSAGKESSREKSRRLSLLCNSRKFGENKRSFMFTSTKFIWAKLLME